MWVLYGIRWSTETRSICEADRQPVAYFSTEDKAWNYGRNHRNPKSNSSPYRYKGLLEMWDDFDVEEFKMDESLPVDPE